MSVFGFLVFISSNRGAALWSCTESFGGPAVGQEVIAAKLFSLIHHLWQQQMFGAENHIPTSRGRGGGVRLVTRGLPRA